MVMKKSDEVAALTSHLSRQSHNILALKDQIDSLLIEKENLKMVSEEKETLLSEKETLIQQMKDSKMAGEGQYMQIISGLQNQIQALAFETSQLRHAMQEKENEFKRQAQELKLLKDKSEESDVLRVQLSENMEVISDLQYQLRNATEKSSQLNDSIIQKDESLKQKVDEYVSLKAQLSEVQESSVLQQKQLELLASEAEQLKVLVSEKELTINNISLSSENLKTQLQEKENACEVLKKQVVELEEVKVNLQKEIQHQKTVIIDMDQSLSEKESSLTENKSLLKTLTEKAREDEEKTNLISQLKSQVHELTQELQKSKELVHERENAFLSLQEKIEAQYELRTELNAALGKKEEVIAGLLNSLKEKDTSIQLADSNVNVLSSEIEVLREKLERSGAAVKNLTKEFQEKNEKLDINQKKMDSLTIELDSLKNEHQKALDQISTWEEELQQKELAVESLRVKCTEQADNIACLKSELNNVNSKSSQDCRDNALLIGSLQCQVESLEKEKNRLQEDADKLMAENAQLTTSLNDLQKKLEELREINEKLETSENYSRMQIDAVKLQMKTEKEKLQMQAKEGASLAAVEISKLKTKVDDLEKALHQTKAFQAETEREIASYQNELAGLRMENNLLLSESQALRNQCQITVAEKDRQIAELQKLQQDVIVKKPVSAGSNYPVKILETASLAGSADTPEEVKHVLAERNQLQSELQRCLQEIHQKDLHFQQINSKVVQSAEENAVLSAQLKTLSQTLRDNQLRYADLQNRYLRLEREYQTIQVTSFQGAVQDETRAEVPPGAPQERSAVIVEMDNMQLNELRKRLAETEQQYDSVQQALSQLTETLAEEKRRREAAEEALGLSEEQSNRFEVSSYRSVPSEYTVQMETEEEREALIINSSEHVIVRKMKGGALSFRRWLRGRSLYCSKLLTSRAKSRYLFLAYLVTLHLVVLLCLTGVL
ncbi:golgin subfamily B member 1 isoform X1 [Gavia stellata]|uniref:golgin subfamily B member 1 isoform X1 n=1 Tax=Gavia stellata TaxID=37040 RepID=UPI00289D8E0A|nr:golgin subfamily B member 1 isoform X1 [Gavia stellata]